MQCFGGLFQRGAAPSTADSALQPSPPQTVVSGYCATQLQPAMFKAGDCITLYHQTSPENAEAILKSGMMRPGPPGFGGSGIYFAPDAQATSCKANHKGVILECTVTLGRVKVAKQACNWGSKLRRMLYKYDSVALTFLEGGIEYVIYDSSRVSSIKVHQMLHHCCSNLGEESSSSGSFRISTAADTGCGSSGQSSEYSGSSGSSVSGDSNWDSSDPCRLPSSSQAPAFASSSCGTTCAPVPAASTHSNIQASAQTALQEALCVLQEQRQPGCALNDSLHNLQQPQQRQQQQQSMALKQSRRLDTRSEPLLLPASQQQHGQLQSVC